MRDRVLELKKGDLIKVVWADASETKNVILKDDIPNRWVETPVTEFGEFVAIKTGKRTKIPHLIMKVQAKNTIGDVIVSIPLPLIVKIERATEKKRILRARRVPRKAIYYRDGSVKIPRTDEKSGKIEIKRGKSEFRWGDVDWRGVIASLLTVALILAVIGGNEEIIKLILGFDAPVIAYYFYKKGRE